MALWCPIRELAISVPLGLKEVRRESRSGKTQEPALPGLAALPRRSEIPAELRGARLSLYLEDVVPPVLGALVTAWGTPRGMMTGDLRISWKTTPVPGIQAPCPRRGGLSGLTTPSVSHCMSFIQKRVGTRSDHGKAYCPGHHPQFPSLQSQDCINGSHSASSHMILPAAPQQCAGSPRS